MRTFFIYDNFEIYTVSEKFWEKGKHRHQFFELLFIKQGAGIHILNENKIVSQAGDIYLMTKDDEHSFRFLEPTEFYCFRFLPDFFNEESDANKTMIKRLLDAMKGYNLSNGNIEMSTADKGTILHLIHRIINEYEDSSLENRLVIKQSMLLILQLISRNILLGGYSTDLRSDPLTIDNIFDYLRQHIAEPELLKKKAVADHFNVSVPYIGEYFTKCSGTSMREFISKLKLNVIENKMVQSKLSNEQIADELKYTDSSHFYKFIKAQTGLSPTKFRAHLLNRND